jgi:hypothetical protein
MATKENEIMKDGKRQRTHQEKMRIDRVTSIQAMLGQKFPFLIVFQFLSFYVQLS